MDLHELKQQFLEYLEIERGRSVKTVENYDRYLKRFFEYAKVKKPGDITENQSVPTIVKSRPIAHTGNSVVMKLDRLRHFNFVNDHLSFSEKKDQIVWRGMLHNESRKMAVEKFHQHSDCNIGEYGSKNPKIKGAKGFLSISQQLKYKFILYNKNIKHRQL